MKEFTAHGYLGLSNHGGLEIEINDSGDGVRVRDTHTNEISDWMEIEHAENIDGLYSYFKDPWSPGRYCLDEFLRV